MIGPRPDRGRPEDRGPRNHRGSRDVEAVDHLDVWERYSRILADQIDSLTGEPDMDRFHALAEERAAVAREIEEGGSPQDSPEGRAAVDRIRERLEACRVADQAVMKRLAELRRDTMRALKGMDERRSGRGNYLTAAAAGNGTPDRRIDVRF